MTVISISWSLALLIALLPILAFALGFVLRGREASGAAIAPSCAKTRPPEGGVVKTLLWCALVILGLNIVVMVLYSALDAWLPDWSVVTIQAALALSLFWNLGGSQK